MAEARAGSEERRPSGPSPHGLYAAPPIRRLSRNRLPRMAQPARRRVVEPAEESPVDPEAIDRAYHYHRARRNARVRRKREKAHARMRFFLTFAVLAGLSVFLLLTIWHEVQKVFGL